MNKYKEKNPIETINNVKAFFNKNKNFTLKINEIHHNQESNTYWCIINLYYKNKLYMSSNGKGTSELFCLASGFGELFERFCSEINIYTNYTLCLKLFDKYKNLQKISAEDAIKDSFCLQFLNDMNIYDYDEQIKSLLAFDDFLFSKQFQNLNNSDEIKNIPITLLYKIIGTTGLSAGNTLEESLVQGLSELCERYVLGQIYLQPELKYYQIPISQISNNNFEIVSQILNNINNQLFIFDLSYTFDLPVCLVLLINNHTKKFYFKLGAFPIFDIALERCLTELYQGIDQSLDYQLNSIQQAYKNIDIYQDIYYTSVGSLHNLSFPEHILFNSTILEKYNDKIYCNILEANNIQLLNYYKNLFKKNNINIYWRQTSPVNFKQMFATQIFSSDLNIYNNYIINDKKINNNIKDIFKESFKIKNIIKDIVINNNDNFQISKYNFYSLSNIFYLDPFSIYPNDTYMLLSIYQGIKENISIPLYIFQNEKFQKIFEYYTIYQFLKNNNYSDKELIQIIQYFNINPKLTQKHENQILNYIIFDDLKKDYQDFDLQDFLIYNEIKEN